MRNNGIKKSFLKKEVYIRNHVIPIFYHYGLFSVQIWNTYDDDVGDDNNDAPFFPFSCDTTRVKKLCCPLLLLRVSSACAINVLVPLFFLVAIIIPSFSPTKLNNMRTVKLEKVAGRRSMYDKRLFVRLSVFCLEVFLKSVRSA